MIIEFLITVFDYQFCLEFWKGKDQQKMSGNGQCVIQKLDNTSLQHS